jgi:hypothetical protein
MLTVTTEPGGSCQADKQTSVLTAGAAAAAASQGSLHAHHDNRAWGDRAVLLLPDKHVFNLQVVAGIRSHLVCLRVNCNDSRNHLQGCTQVQSFIIIDTVCMCRHVGL